MKKDYSEYKPSEYEKYRLKRSNNKYVRYDYFNNKVGFVPEDKNIFIHRSYFDDNVYSIYKNYPDKEKEPLNNVLSGAHISLRYGEGLLDFIYADFTTPFKKELKFLSFLKQLGETQKDDVTDERQETSSSEKIYNRTQDITEEYFRYDSTVMYTKSISIHLSILRSARLYFQSVTNI